MPRREETQPLPAPDALPAPASEESPSTEAPDAAPLSDWQLRFAEHFSPEIVSTEDSYSSPNLSVTVTHHRMDTDKGPVVYHLADIHITGRNPRTAIAYYEPGHYCFLVADGRQSDYSVGMTLDEMSEIFSSLGCKAAFNLDGGGSSMMAFQGELVCRSTAACRAT